MRVPLSSYASDDLKGSISAYDAAEAAEQKLERELIVPNPELFSAITSAAIPIGAYTGAPP